MGGDFDIGDVAAMKAKLSLLRASLPDAEEAKMKRIILQIERDAKSIVPVDTGNLRASIESRVIRNNDGDITGVVGTNTDYAAFVEFGTSKMGAQPYLRPAVEQNRETVRELLGEGFNDAVERSD
jgi:HK97 gp10 family phage protein